MERFRKLDARRVPSPCFVVDEVAIEENCGLLAHVQRESGAKVLAALKAFSMWSLAPLIARHLAGICASGLHEARLGREAYGGEVHTFSAAFTELSKGNAVNVTGASGSLDFDLQTGEAPSDIQIWCLAIDPNTGKAGSYVNSGYYFDAATKMLAGAVGAGCQ